MFEQDLKIFLKFIYMKESHSSDVIYHSARKDICSGYKKSYATPSKLNDKILLSGKSKRRQSRRASIIGRFAEVKIIYPSLDSKNNPEIFAVQKNKNQINPQLLIKSQMLIQKNAQKAQRINKMIQYIIKSKDNLSKMTKLKEQFRKSFHQSEKNVEYFERQYLQASKRNFELKKKQSQISYQIKRQFYEIVAQERHLQPEIQMLNQKIQQNKKAISHRLRKFQEITQEVLEAENRQKLQNQQLKESNQMLAKLKRKLEIEQSHTFILKLQLNPNLYTGFNVILGGQDKKLLLDKDYMTWDRSKVRKITIRDLKRYVLILLYRGWKKLLRKLSYQSTQYQILFGEIENQILLEGLRDILHETQIRASSRKITKTLFISSNGSEDKIKKQLCEQLMNFNNNLLHITSVQFLNKTDDNQKNLPAYQSTQQLRIVYKTFFNNFYQENQEVQVFDIITRPSINKQELVRLIRQPDRRMFCYIQIPLLFPKNQFNKYEQIYDVIRKKNLKF